MHNLNYNSQEGRHAVFSAKQKMWHNKGKVVDNALTSSEAIKEALLDWNVAMFQNSIEFNGKSKISRNSFSSVRLDTGDILGGRFSNTYHPVQNSTAFDFFDNIIGNKEAVFETAGALGKGEIVFITAKMPSYIRIGKDDIIENYLFCFNSHNGQLPLMVGITPVRVVCNNTVNATLSTCTNVVKIRHSANAEMRLHEAANVMGIYSQYSKDIEEAFNFMATKRVLDSEVRQLVKVLFSTESAGDATDVEKVSTRLSNITDNILHYYHSAESQQLETTKGTAFGAYNAITGYFQNVKKFKDDDQKFKSILLGGQGQTIQQKAFDYLIKK